MQTKNITPLFSAQQAGTENAVVQDIAKDTYIVKASSGVFNSSRAFSCLVRPEVGDQVMLASDEQGSRYILAVLHRPAGNQTVLAFPGDMTLETPTGKCAVVSRDGLSVASAGDIDMLSENISIAAGQANFHVAETMAQGNELTSNVKRIRVFASSIDTVAERLSQRLKQSFRWVEQLDQTNAGQMIHAVRNLFALRSRQAMITAKQDVKIDGERIHMG